MTITVRTIEIPEHVYTRLYRLVGTKLRRHGEPYARAMQSAVVIALTNFLDGLEAEDEEHRTPRAAFGTVPN